MPVHSHKSLYHDTLKIPTHKWEKFREIAAQKIGFEPSGMWGNLNVKPINDIRTSEHYASIARSHHPAVFAKMLEAEHAHDNFGLKNAIENVIQEDK